jgi:hypothetical protein
MFEEKITKLAELRKEFVTREEDYRLAKLNFELSFPFKDYRDCEAEILELETKIRQEAEANFKTTGEKQPHPAVDVKEKTELLVDELEALKYAYENLTDALALDHKVFGKVMKALPPEKVPACVTILQVPKAYIQKDLSEFLGEEIQDESKRVAKKD